MMDNLHDTSQCHNETISIEPFQTPSLVSY